MADESVLNASIRSNLCDNKPDKRKQAALDIEAAVRSVLRSSQQPGAVAGHGHEQAARFVRCLAEDFCRSAFPSRRKGGLIGLASVVIALEHKPAQSHVSQLVPPVLTCFSDEDAGVRYSACEAFYNIAKVARGGILAHLPAVFDGLCRLYADVDQNVKDGAQCLDRLVRDIVTECRDFNYSAFIPLLTTRIRVLNPCVRQLVLGWIVLLDSVPQVDMIVYLPQYLEGLFNILASDNRDIRHSTEVCLGELLAEIKASALERPARAQRAIADASRTVARCCRAGERRPEDNYVRLMALHWLLEFVKLQAELEGATSGEEERERCPSPVPEAGPAPTGSRWPAPSGLHVSHARTASTGNSAASPPAVSLCSGLRQLVPVLLTGALHCLDDGEGEIRENAQQANAHLRGAARWLGGDLPVEAIAEAVMGAMRDGVAGQERSPAVLLKCIGWAQLMLSQCPVRVLQPAVRDRLLEAALAVLTRPEEDVAVAALRFIANLVATGDDGSAPASAAEPEGAVVEEGGDLFARMCHRLFELMAEDATVLSNRGELIVRRLCDGVDAERFFATAARAVAGLSSSPQDKLFAQRLVRVLNRVLLTSRETRALRARLRADATASPRPGAACTDEGEVPALLLQLLLSWFHCPVSTLALCLWLHWFELAAEVAARLVGVEPTAELQAQLNDFVELLESPVFMRVRLQLLESRRRPALLRTILALVALLPQEQTLRARLDIVETGLLLDRLGANSNLAPLPAKPVPEPLAHLLGKLDIVIDAHGWRKCIL